MISNAILFIINNLCIIFFAWVVSSLKGERQVNVKVLKGAIIYFAEILSIVIVTGLFLSILNLYSITVFCLLLFAASIVLLKFKKISLSFNLRNFIRIFATENRFINVISLIVGISLLIKLANALILIPYSYDSTAYHLPNLVDYIQNQKIFLSYKEVFSNSYPRNIEMLNLWTLIYFRNGVFLNLVQYTITLIGAVAIYSILKEQKIKKEYAYLGGLIYLSTPIILAQMATTYVDTALASFFICAVYFTLRYFDKHEITDVIYTAICLGILLGIKYTGLGYFAVFIFMLLLIEFFKGEKYINIIKRITFVTLIVFIFGGFWYALNYINFENPIYPFGVNVLGKTVIQGYDIDRKIMTAQTPNVFKNENSLVRIALAWSGVPFDKIKELQGEGFSKIVVNFLEVSYDQRLGGFGYLWPIFLIPSIIFFTIKCKNISKSEIIILGIPILGFLITPQNWWTRYTAFFILVGIYCFIKLLKKPNSNIFMTFLTLLILINCIQGNIFEMYLDKHYFKNYISSGQKWAIRSLYNQAYSDDLKKFSPKINDRAYKIVVFEVEPCNKFYYQGDNTQNKLYFYSKTTPIKLNNYNVNTYEKFRRILDLRNADYVIISKDYVNYIDNYINTKENYLYYTNIGADRVYEKKG